MTVLTRHSAPRAVFYALSISLCITIDILQYSMPLPFLPQSLEDKGHSSIRIATAIGGYYWSGFIGGVCITSFQIYRVIFRPPSKLSRGDIRRHVLFLIIGLFVGALTLVAEGLVPTLLVHTICRLAQGFLGAFLFFFSFLLAIELFSGKQQIFALTAATVALNVAEVFGPFLGASVFSLWGDSASFFILAVASVVNQIFLCVVYGLLASGGNDAEEAPLVLNSSSANSEDSYETPPNSARIIDGFCRIRDIISSPFLLRSVIIITPAALMKSSIEELLPFFADHELQFDEVNVGCCFSVVAVSFTAASVLAGLLWREEANYDRITNAEMAKECKMLYKRRTWIVGTWLAMLGCFAACIMLAYEMFPTPSGIYLFYALLVLYGLSLGATHTPASYFIGAYIDSLEDTASKDAANGIWNTMWELGGSIGFLLASFPNTTKWWEEATFLACLGCVIVLASIAFLQVSSKCDQEHIQILSRRFGKGELSY
jgi:hypothetical protein